MLENNYSITLYEHAFWSNNTVKYSIGFGPVYSSLSLSSFSVTSGMKQWYFSLFADVIVYGSVFVWASYKVKQIMCPLFNNDQC